MSNKREVLNQAQRDAIIESFTAQGFSVNFDDEKKMVSFVDKKSQRSHERPYRQFTIVNPKSKPKS